MSRESNGDGASPPAVSGREKRLEIVTTLLLAIAAIGTAWSGYQAALWDGIQSSMYTQASAARTEASQNHLEANQERIVDLTLLENYLDADYGGEHELAEFYRTRFRDEFEPAFEAWMALGPGEPGAPRSPLNMPQYRLEAEEEANELNSRADARFAEGEEANTISDTYVATTLFFASVLFFAAISERFDFILARIALLVLAGLSFLGGLATLLSQPVTMG